MEGEGRPSRYAWAWRLLVIVLMAGVYRTCAHHRREDARMAEYRRTHDGREPGQYLAGADSIEAYYHPERFWKHQQELARIRAQRVESPDSSH